MTLLYYAAVASYLQSGAWSYLQLTYDNGDMSDNWCRSHTLVPPELVSRAFYQVNQLKCGSRSYLALALNAASLQLGGWPGASGFFICE